MAGKRKMTGRTMSLAGGSAVGIGISLLSTIAGAMIVAWLVITERMAEGSIGYGSMAILVLSSAIGCAVAWKLVRHRKLLVLGIGCCGYYVALLCVALVFGAGVKGMGTTAIMVIMGGAICLIPGRLERRGGVKRRKIPAYR